MLVGVVHQEFGLKPYSGRTKQGADPEPMIGKDCAGSLHKFCIVCSSTFISQTTQGPSDGVGEGEGPGTGLGDGDGLGLGPGPGLGDGEGETPGDGPGEGLVGGDTGGMTKQAANKHLYRQTAVTIAAACRHNNIEQLYGKTSMPSVVVVVDCGHATMAPTMAPTQAINVRQPQQAST
jgi:hypothetical protein